MSISRIKKNDNVIVISGREKGKKGKILEVIVSRGRAIVEGVNLVKKCLRKSQDKPQGGITDKEASIAVSNLMLFCAECKKGVRVRFVRETGKSVRKCGRCGHVFDT
ncbi:MAG: 50S ribosomal protein L24 [Desulfobulbaceae bacterium]|nr:50S ribosomal protein L24 [Desulfobulbaceae bacterium]